MSQPQGTSNATHRSELQQALLEYDYVCPNEDLDEVIESESETLETWHNNQEP